MTTPAKSLPRLALAGAAATLTGPLAPAAAVDSNADLRRAVKPFITPSAANAASPSAAASFSPFQPQTANLAAAPSVVPLEFRGVAEDDAGRKFRLYDPARKLGEWVTLNQPSETIGAVAVGFRPQSAGRHHGELGPTSDILDVEYQGRRYALALRNDRVASSGSAATVLPPKKPVAPPVPHTMGALEKVTKEVERRREERDRALLAARPPAATSVVAPKPKK